MTIALGALAVLLVVGLVVQGVRIQQQSARADDRSAVLELAEAQVIDLTTLDAESIDDKIAQMQERTTGDFARQLEGMAATFSTVVKDGAIDATGQIDAAAVVTLEDDAAQVIIASQSSVINAGATEPTTRSYRISVDLVREEDTWLISSMEFVP